MDKPLSIWECALRICNLVYVKTGCSMALDVPSIESELRKMSPHTLPNGTSIWRESYCAETKYPGIRIGERDRALRTIQVHTEREIERKGDLPFASAHEALGVITEEYDELLDAVRANDSKLVLDELIDIATAAHFAIACIQEGKTSIGER